LADKSSCVGYCFDSCRPFAQLPGIGAVLDVPGLAGEFQQCFHQKLEHRSVGASDTASHNVLFHLRCAETLQSR